MTIFKLFLGQNFSKILSKTHQIAPFLKIFSGSMPPNPLANCGHALHANTPTFPENF